MKTQQQKENLWTRCVCMTNSNVAASKSNSVCFTLLHTSILAVRKTKYTIPEICLDYPSASAKTTSLL